MTLAERTEALLNRHWWRPRPSALARGLWPLSRLYQLLDTLHRRQVLPRQYVPVPVLVVGNMVVGGAGKTPTVIALVQAFQRAGHRPGVISRGHGRIGSAALQVQHASAVSEVGDEPLLIQRRCNVPVWVGRDRAATARALCAAHADVDVLVSDDGLQHAALPRQAELWVFDARGVGNGWLLPAGPLRQPMPTVLPEHTRVLYTQGQASTALPGALATRQADWAWPLRAWHAGEASARQPLQALRGRQLLACAGMAAPDKFFGMLDEAGLQLKRLSLPDHHPYTTLPWPADTPEVVTTEKDAVKLDPARMGSTRVWVVPLDLQLSDGLIAELRALLFTTP